MLTPQEIQDKKFEKAVFGGYDMGQVDQFLDAVLSDYTSLYKESATLKAKMRVLVDKIEEYRAVDEEMRKTLYAAQVAARDMTEKARAQADNLLAETRQEISQQVAEMKVEIEAEEKRLAEAKKASATYIHKIKEAMRRNIELMDGILETPQQELLQKPRPAGRPDPREDFEVVLPDDVLAEPAPRLPAEPEPRPEPAPEPVPEPVPVAEPALDAELASGADDGTPPVPAYLDAMETQFFEIELGGARAGAETGEDEESDTAKIYGDTTFTPKPRFDFSDIRFGKDYHEDGR